MCKSIGSLNVSFEPGAGGGGRIHRTASTTSAASFDASDEESFVASEVFTTFMSVARSMFDDCLNLSKN